MTSGAGGRTARVLVVDDEPEVRNLLQRLLESEGYNVAAAADMSGAKEAMKEADLSLVLLDVMLGGDDGLTLLADLRRVGEVPVILLTGRGAEADRIEGLKLGADDYIVKPFSPGELVARVATVLRRSGMKAPSPKLQFDGLEIDTIAREVVSRGEPIELTAKEFDLLTFLAASPRQVFSRHQLLEHVWASSSAWQDEATVTEHVRRIRRKIEVDPDNPRWIATMRGVGYRFEP